MRFYNLAALHAEQFSMCIHNEHHSGFTRGQHAISFALNCRAATAMFVSLSRSLMWSANLSIARRVLPTWVKSPPTLSANSYSTISRCIMYKILEEMRLSKLFTKFHYILNIIIIIYILLYYIILLTVKYLNSSLKTLELSWILLHLCLTIIPSCSHILYNNMLQEFW